MAGFDLKEGKYEEKAASEDELWSTIAYLFTTYSRNNTSYKYGFLKSILDNLDNVDIDFYLTFDQLFSRFTEIYWELILVYNLRQKAKTYNNRVSAIEKVLLDAKAKYDISEVKSFNNLPEKIKMRIVYHVKTKCKTYVIGALYEDTKQLFYSFSKKEGWIQINPKMYRFLCDHKNEIEELNNYEWAFFLEKINSGYSMNQILLLINKTDSAIEEDLGDRGIGCNRPVNGYIPITIDSIDNDIDEEAMALLDDPEALIKLLKKRRGI